MKRRQSANVKKKAPPRTKLRLPDLGILDSGPCRSIRNRSRDDAGFWPNRTAAYQTRSLSFCDTALFSTFEHGLAQNSAPCQVEGMESEAELQHPASKERVVFSILRDSQCLECGEALWKGNFLFMEKERSLCLACADLDHLVYLPRGDAALTRRAKKHSTLSAVVVRFSRARGHYERQGVLVEESALQEAEHECFQDAGLRVARRERQEVRRVEQDRDLGTRLADAIRELFPGCTRAEALAIAKHTTAPGSGRVGRTAAGKALDERAITAAAIAAIRHTYTRYDELLMGGFDRVDAREAVRETVDRVLDSWRKPA